MNLRLLDQVEDQMMLLPAEMVDPFLEEASKLFPEEERDLILTLSEKWAAQNT